MTIRVLLVDDHPIVRQGLHRLLEFEPDFSVVGEAGDGLEALAMLDDLQPDVVILDLMMPGINGLEVTSRMLERKPDMRVVVLSMHQDEGYVLQALRSGARGYVVKDSSPRELAVAIRLVAGGGSYLSQAINQQVMKLMQARLDEPEPAAAGDQGPGSGQPKTGSGGEPNRKGGTQPLVSGVDKQDPYELLSKRERLVLKLIAEGNTNSEVARHLDISPRTVEAHRASIMHKLELSNVTELMRFAIKRGIIQLDS